MVLATALSFLLLTWSAVSPGDARPRVPSAVKAAPLPPASKPGKPRALPPRATPTRAPLPKLPPGRTAVGARGVERRLPVLPASAKWGRPSGARGVPITRGAIRKPRHPAVTLYHVNHRETLDLRLVDDRGRPLRGVERRVNRFFRCHHTNAQARMHPRLVRLLYETGRSYPGRRIAVVSGYRHPKVAKNPRSPHKRGLACDLRVEGVKNTELRDFFRARFKGVGVGYYPNSSFVHLDVRDGPSAFWIDYSGPGESAMYAEDPRADVESGRAERWKPTTIDLSWADEPEAEEAVQ
jgi:uncharacterized protein YcbK (DUF882 family)